MWNFETKLLKFYKEIMFLEYLDNLRYEAFRLNIYYDTILYCLPIFSLTKFNFKLLNYLLNCYFDSCAGKFLLQLLNNYIWL